MLISHLVYTSKGDKRMKMQKNFRVTYSSSITHKLPPKNLLPSTHSKLGLLLYHEMQINNQSVFLPGQCATQPCQRPNPSSLLTQRAFLQCEAGRGGSSGSLWQRLCHTLRGHKQTVSSMKERKKKSILPTLVTLILFKGLKRLVGKAMGSVSRDGFH